MDYRDFRTAAHRHLVSCSKMCELLGNASDEEKRNLISDIYYLSGYVVETLISYAIFSVAPKNIKNKPIEEHPDYENGFKTHNFQAKISFALKHSCDFGGISLISNQHPNTDINNLFRGWTIEVRYQHPTKFVNKKTTISDQLIIEYIDVLKNVEKQFHKKFI